MCAIGECAALEAGGAILMNLKSASILYVQSEDVRIPPASLTKIMTMYLAMDAIGEGKISSGDAVIVSKRAASQPGARMGLKTGDSVVLDELLKGTAVASGNDAAVAVAEYMAGSVEAFSKMMNDKAAELGMSKTVFKNPNGLPSKGHETTARDMLILSRGYIENHPEALPYHKILSITYNGRTTTNKNPLLRMYPHVDGLKTGWTNASKHNLIATAASGDVRLVSVILGAPTSKDLTYGSAFLIESGFRTVESGGRLKVAQQLEAVGGEISFDIPPAPDPSKPVSADAGAVSGDTPASSDKTLSYYDGIPPRLAEELEFEYDIEPGDDTEFGEIEFDDPSVWPGSDMPPETEGADDERRGDAVREIDARQVIDAVEALCIKANYIASEDIKDAIRQGLDSEDNAASRDVLGQLLENAEISAEGNLPLCQDTGMAVVFVEMGQDVRLTGGSIRDAINEGVRRGYKDGYLRASVVADPIDRVNTGDNTPAVIYFDIVPGDRLKITVAPKGFGSENMSGVLMLTPSQGIAGIKRFVIDTVRSAGANPCPPIIVGVGVGGTMDYAALMAKKALLRPVGSTNGSWLWTGLERELLEEINSLDIGPAGLGGKTTALAVHIETFPTHIAGLPIAVNIGCHATRHVETTL
ncbi:MAG: fumarate hydratase [Synergistaceae bacterium]|nr:fumarate hydratase [Synergistaceae bacterium]